MPAVLFRNEDSDPARDHFVKHYIPLVEFKNFNALINNKPFFDQHIRYKQEVYEKPLEMWRNDAYTTENLLDCLYHQDIYKLIGIDLLRYINSSISQQINFTGKLEKTDTAMMFFHRWKASENCSSFSFRFINCNRIK